jgi:Cation transporter/ATPase, N-terminus
MRTWMLIHRGCHHRRRQGRRRLLPQGAVGAGGAKPLRDQAGAAEGGGSGRQAPAIAAGLTSEEARRRLAEVGPNAMPDTEVHPVRGLLGKTCA